VPRGSLRSVRMVGHVALQRSDVPMNLRFANSPRVTGMLIEVIGNRSLPDDVDRDDVEDLLTSVLGADGEVTGAGVGMGQWHLDVEVSAGPEQFKRVIRGLAIALVGQNLGWVMLRAEHEETGEPADKRV